VKATTVQDEPERVEVEITEVKEESS